MISEEAFDKLLTDTHEAHEFWKAKATHVGMNRTFLFLNQKYFIFGMRRKISDYIKCCPVCIANNHTRSTSKDTSGIVRPDGIGAWLQADFVGPLQLGSGNKYICVLIECFSKHIWACPTKGCSDADLMDGLIHVEQTYGAIPKRLQVDGALCKPLTLSKKYLDSLGVNLYHGHPRVSRNQSTVERAISTLMRTLTKLSIATPTKSETQLLKSAVAI